ncbi:hypothetical protein [Plantactinospora sp. GCM10030261]|uniref:hypothetical protein n=1 Tax=Plantactinospora sp. GCM10030261 TaxID=3273420 RepID=UPI003617C711
MTAPVAAPDPRDRADGLGWVTRAVFADARLRVGIGPIEEAAMRFAVVPSVRRARFLLPLAGRPVAAAALLAYNALRPTPVRLARAAVGAAARLGAARLAPFPMLSIAVPAGVDPTEVLLTHRLTAALGGERLHAAIGVRPPDPNRKPTLQLFDDGGRPRGYAKIGWNGATRDLVRAEGATLTRLPTAPVDPAYPLVPRLLTTTEWGGQQVAVIAPLPPDVRRLADPRSPRLAAIRAVSRGDAAEAVVRPLAGSPLHRRFAAAAARAAAVDHGRCARAVTALVDRCGRMPMEFGCWHGDWVPWNLGQLGDRLVAWDWEHAGTGVPLGFDLVHQAFQEALVVAGRPVDRAARAAETAVRRYGAELGLDPAVGTAVVDAYLIEMWLRTWRLAVGGAGWNPALHPGLLDLLDSRLS